MSYKARLFECIYPRVRPYPCEYARPTDEIDSPWVSGISPGPKGAYSIALSGGYDDDVDEGYAL